MSEVRARRYDAARPVRVRPLPPAADRSAGPIERMSRRKRKLLAERRIVRQEEISIAAEVNHIVKRAIAGQGCVVSLGRLVFFATVSREAWLLDAEDDLALELARAGRRLPVTITESPERFTIEWGGTFRIDGEVMTFTNALGCSRSAIGYPVREIAKALDRARQ